MVVALNPRSWPMMGRAKACTSQQVDNSQLASSRRFMPGTASRLHTPLPAPGLGLCVTGLRRGTRLALQKVNATSGSISA